MAKKQFGNIVDSIVAKPVEEHREHIAQVSPSQRKPKFKMNLNDDNAMKRTFYIKFDLIDKIEEYAHIHRIDKGALINIALNEWISNNKDRTEFE